jgi:hypothetical protein
MQRNVLAHIASTVLVVATLAVASADASAQQAGTSAQSSEPPPADPSFSAYSLSRLCEQKNDNVAQATCVGAIRGIIHGYQYGVLFVGQRAPLPAGTVQRVSLCLSGTPVAMIVDEFIDDAQTAGDDALKRTPAEVAVLGSVHLHHACN